MKKLYIIVIVFFITIVFINKPVTTKADIIANFQSVELLGKGRLLSFYVKNENNSNLKKELQDEINRIKKIGEYEWSKNYFWGTSYEYFNYRTPVKFIKSTELTIDNSGGTTPIEYVLKERIEKHAKFVLETAYGISTKASVSGKDKTKTIAFGGDLGTKLNIDTSLQISLTFEQQKNLTIKIDPGTKLIIEIIGYGFVTNGVSSFRRFWIGGGYGYFQYLEISSQSIHIRKVPA